MDLIVASEEVPIDDYTENGAWELKSKSLNEFDHMLFYREILPLTAKH